MSISHFYWACNHVQKYLQGHLNIFHFTIIREAIIHLEILGFYFSLEWVLSQPCLDKRIAWFTVNPARSIVSQKRREVNAAPAGVIWAYCAKRDENLFICLSQLGLSFLSFTFKRSLTGVQVSKGESDYSGVGSGFGSQWARVMLAIFLSVLYKSYQNLERPDLYRIWVKSTKANSTINTSFCTCLLCPSRMLILGSGWWPQQCHTFSTKSSDTEGRRKGFQQDWGKVKMRATPLGDNQDDENEGKEQD